ncbi:MAG: hypothetical protein AAF438_22765, partial [Pseudomonadota bacterium]
LNVSQRRGRLYTQINQSNPMPLIPVNPTHFRRPHQTDATIAIVTTEDEVVIQGDFGNFARPRPKNRE